MNEPGAPRAAVIGTGRCGTGYMAAMLGATGINAGHEHWWHGAPWPGLPKAELDVDCSWLALPQIEQAVWNGPVIHLIREPVAVVASLLGTRFFDPDNAGSPYTQFALRWCLEVRNLPPLEACVEWWAAWNARCAAVADATIRVEDIPADPVAAAARIAIVLDGHLSVPVDPAALEQAAVTTPTNVNSRERETVAAEAVWSLVGNRANAFGYAALCASRSTYTATCRTSPPGPRPCSTRWRSPSSPAAMR
jgi:hypothetical protein